MDYEKWQCKTTNWHFLLCSSCACHSIAQDWMKTNFRAQDGKKNLASLWKGIGDNTAVINSNQVIPDQASRNQSVDGESQNQPENTQDQDTADIGEILSEGDSAFVRAVLVNQLRIGRAFCPYEVIK